MAATWKGRCSAFALLAVPIILASTPTRAPADVLIGRFNSSQTTVVDYQAYAGGCRDQAEPADPAGEPDYLGSLGLDLSIRFFPPHYGNPPPHQQTTPPPPVHHDPPPVDNPPPTDHAPEPATLISGALGMGLLSLYGAARRKKNKN